jgi:hypothetical protein
MASKKTVFTVRVMVTTADVIVKPLPEKNLRELLQGGHEPAGHDKEGERNPAKRP